MTWEETIKYIRTKKEYKDLVRLTYIDENLSKNVELYKSGDEFIETLKILKKYSSKGKTILDMGCGNGISSISFALEGYSVSSVEPDKSDTVGAGAIKKLINIYNLSNLKVFEDFAENIKFQDNSFDIVYARQAMHHAKNLNKFVAEMARVLKPDGLFLTVRDHAIFDEKDKNWFLESHPLQKFYGGENAFTPQEYKNAIKKSGLTLVKELKFFDNIINYYPLENPDVIKKQHLRNKIGIVSKFPFVFTVYKNYIRKKTGDYFFEKKIPGRMYSYIAIKK